MKHLDSLRPAPLNWEYLRTPNTSEVMLGLGYFRRIEAGDRLCAMVTVDLYEKGEPGAGQWLHLSVTRQRRMPSWEDLVCAREELGYKDFVFIQLLPPTKHWLNVHAFCLHLFTRLDTETVPRILWDQEGCDGTNYRSTK